MGKPNALSRHADHGEGLNSDNEDITLLPPDVFRIHALALRIAAKVCSVLHCLRCSASLMAQTSANILAFSLVLS